MGRIVDNDDLITMKRPCRELGPGVRLGGSPA